jgi:UDPglucose--hexose-1-phosphate uridylyltransferase
MKLFHDFSVATNYIKTKRIAHNINYKYQGKYVPLDITINLSKPEKDPKDIQKQSQQTGNYPACPLCMENEGVYQSTSLAPRSNHRVISLSLNHEEDAWGLQFSPYAYFNEHLIVLRKEHSPMYVNEKTFAELVDFINKFPQYLIGSNAGLPIVGGSILGHHHFQGGRYDFPIEKAKALLHYKRRKVDVEVLYWPMAVVRISSNNENALLDAVNDLYQAWRQYDRPDLNIHAHTNADHNTVTPILKLNGSMYQFYIVLRNNFATEEQPYGLFHPREEYFHIKKENIGLIEVMGMAILPGRLVDEVRLIEQCLGENKETENHVLLDKHQAWINHLRTLNLNPQDIKDYLMQDIGRIFEAVLEDCNVFRFGTKEDLFRFVEKAI